MTDPTPDRDILLQLIGSITLADHIGDVAEDVWYALKKIGIPPPADIGALNELGDWLGSQGITTLYGSSLGGGIEDQSA